MLLCNQRVCTWPQKTHCYCHTQTAWRPPPSPNKPAPCCFLSLQGWFIYTARHNDFLNKGLERPVCFSSLLSTVTSLSLRGRSSCTFLTWQLSDCLRIIWCCSHVGQTGRGLLQKIERERESLDLFNVELTVLLHRLQGGDSVKATGKRNRQCRISLLVRS